MGQSCAPPFHGWVNPRSKQRLALFVILKHSLETVRLPPIYTRESSSREIHREAGAVALCNIKRGRRGVLDGEERGENWACSPHQHAVYALFEQRLLAKVYHRFRGTHFNRKRPALWNKGDARVKFARKQEGRALCQPSPFPLPLLFLHEEAS